MESSKTDSCDYFDSGTCRSCNLLPLAKIERDTKRIEQLASTLNIDAKQIEPFRKPQTSFGSRHKAKLSVSGSLENPVIGLIDSELDGVELLDCPLHAAPINRLIHLVKDLVPKHKLFPYEISSQRGELKGLIIKCNANEDQISLRFVLRSTEAVARIRKAVPTIQESMPEVSVVSANIQPVPHAILEGEKEIILTTNKYIWDEYGGFALAYAPNVFSQVNSQVALKLYEEAGEQFKRIGAKGFLDLYCGVGGFSFSIGRFAEWGIGVESAHASIACANVAKLRNTANSLEFRVGGVEAFLATYVGKKADVVVLNPPRAGLRSAVDEILSLSPPYLFYSSCNLESLGKDFDALKGAYAIERVIPFDMFPLTSHVEALVVFKLKAPPLD